MSQPLESIRILDLSQVTAGPNATLILGDMGAEILKVEGCSYTDPYRLGSLRIRPKQGDGSQRAWNRAAPFNALNRNKYGLTLDLKTAKGKDIFLRLVKICDVVVENFRNRVMKTFGLDYEVLAAVKPDIVMISIGSQGSVGPEKDYASYGSTLDATSGLASLGGYGDGIPMWSGVQVNYPDQAASAFAAGLILSAIRYRNKTGRGVYVDYSQRELTTCLIGEAFIDYSMNRKKRPVLGNRSAVMAPHGCYPCLGQDRWITLAVTSDEEWQALCKVMGREDLVSRKDLAALSGRLDNQDEVDEIITEWAAQEEQCEAMEILQGAGIAAGPAFDGKDMLSNPHLAARGFFHVIDPPETVPFPIRSIPMKFSKTSAIIRMPAPTLGQHNELILKNLLGLPDAEITELRHGGIIGDALVGIAADRLR